VTVLKRSPTRRPCFRLIARLFWVLLSWWWRGWREVLTIIQADTVLRWRGDGMTVIWKYRSRGRRRGWRPRIAVGARQLVYEMARANFLLGCITYSLRAAEWDRRQARQFRSMFVFPNCLPFRLRGHKISTMSRFQPSPRRTQRANFWHYALLLARMEASGRRHDAHSYGIKLPRSSAIGFSKGAIGSTTSRLGRALSGIVLQHLLQRRSPGQVREHGIWRMRAVS